MGDSGFYMVDMISIQCGMFKSIHLTSFLLAVVACRNGNVSVQAGTTAYRHEEVRSLLIQRNRVKCSVTFAAQFSVARKSRIELYISKRQILVCYRIPHIRVVVGEIKINPTDNSFLGYFVRDGSCFLDSVSCLFLYYRERSLRIEIFGFQWFLQIFGKNEPFILYAFRGIDYGLVFSCISFDSQYEQTIISLVKSFGIDFRSGSFIIAFDVFYFFTIFVYNEII